MKKLASEKKPVYLYFLLLFLCMFILSCMTPLALDDFGYAFSFTDFTTRITKISQIFPSMAAHSHRVNGRLFAHGLVQFFMMYPKLLFNLFNGFNAALLAWLFSRYFSDKKPGEQVFLLVCGAMLIWSFSPAFGENFLWLDGACNYAWGLSFMLLFLWPYAAAYLELPYKRGPLRLALFCLLAFVAGAYSENGSCAMLFIALCLLGLSAIGTKKLPPFLLLGFLFAAAGFAWLMLAPTTTTRGADAVSLSSLGAKYVTILACARDKLFPLYILYGVLLSAALFFKADRRRIILSVVLILAGIGSLACFLFAWYFALRHFCFTVITAALACLLLLAELLKEPSRLLPYLCAGALSVLFLFNAAAGGLDILVGCGKMLARQARIREAQAAGQSYVVLDEHLSNTCYGINFELNDFPPDWPNMWIAKLYGFDVVYKTGTEDNYSY